MFSWRRLACAKSHQWFSYLIICGVRLIALHFTLNLLHAEVTLQQEIILQLLKSVLRQVSAGIERQKRDHIQYTVPFGYAPQQCALSPTLQVDTCA